MNNFSLPACLPCPLFTGNKHIPNHVLLLSPSLAVPHEGLVHLVLLDSWKSNAAASDGVLEAVATPQQLQLQHQAPCFTHALYLAGGY